MEAFLTSSPTKGWSEELEEKNGFASAIAKSLGKNFIRTMFFPSDPADSEGSLGQARWIERSFRNAGIEFSLLRVVDGFDGLSFDLDGIDLAILAGGHVPTQNAFFRRIGLKEKLAGYGNVLLAISAGSMNAAKVVYAQPEEEGEASSPTYERFLEGLGITEVNIIPHYDSIRDAVLDGMRIVEDITLSDSMGRRFVLIPDGSYIKVDDEKTVLYGRAYEAVDGVLRKISEDGRMIVL